ncbi:MAG: hypothetical protein VX780_08255 [Pseudomonadota bacterium]|nr:hypothetical protein [Pseudomonadota bacterium]
MSEPLERDEVIELLNALGSEEDEDALSAARALHSKIAQASLSWDELLVGDENEENQSEQNDQPLSENFEDEAEIGENQSEKKDQPPSEDFEDEGEIEESSSIPTETVDDVPSVDNPETLTLIEKLLKREGNSNDLREELEGYKIDISNGEFEVSDHKYVKALYLRLMKGK